MRIDLTRLISHFIEEIRIDEKITFDEDYLKNTDIRELNNVEVKGIINSTTENLYVLDINVKGEMILPDSITLEDVIYPFDINIDEILSDDEELEEKYIKIINKSIDIMPIIWQNIVMEVPLTVTRRTSHVMMEGDGWRLITSEEQDNENNSEQ